MPAEDADRQLPSDLDQLVRSALLAGNIQGLKKALEKTTPGAAPQPAPPAGAQPRAGRAGLARPRAASARAVGGAGTRGHPAAERAPTRKSRAGRIPEGSSAPLPSSVVLAPSGPSAEEEAVLLRRLGQLVGELQGAEAAGGLGPVRAELITAVEILQELVDGLAPSPGSEPTPAGGSAAVGQDQARVVLLPVRQAWLLFVRSTGDFNRAPDIARALEIDHLTARKIARSRHPIVALRGEDAARLERLGHRYEQSLGVGSCVVSRSALEAQGHPQVALGRSGDTGLRTTRVLAWQETADTRDLPEAGTVTLAAPLVVAGEISIRRYRQVSGRRGRGRASLRETNARRIGVVDLHTPTGFVRLVEGVTDLSGLPGHINHSSRRSLRGLAEQAAARWPSAEVLEMCICQAGDPPRPDEGSGGRSTVVATGWPAWEEYTRACRYLKWGSAS